MQFHLEGGRRSVYLAPELQARDLPEPDQQALLLFLRLWRGRRWTRRWGRSEAPPVKERCDVAQGNHPMITITFPDRDTEKKALAFFLGRFSGRDSPLRGTSGSGSRVGSARRPEHPLHRQGQDDLGAASGGDSRCCFPSSSMTADKSPGMARRGRSRSGRSFRGRQLRNPKVEGHWRHSGVVYRDNLVKVVVDVPDSPKNRRWMKEFKGRWKTRLEQLDLWMVSYRVDIE